MFLPWPVKRLILMSFCGFEVHPTSRIGIAYVAPKKLIMEENTCIGHFTVRVNLDLVHLKRNARVSRGNWITGFPSGSTKHFVHQKSRKPGLIAEEHSAITNRHIIDCTDTVTVGAFSTLAGFCSQILTHSIDIEKSIQSSEPVSIGKHCFVGTDTVILGGSSLPDYSVLGAKSLLNKKFEEEYCLYAGVPAKAVKKLSKSCAYFTRSTGYVM